MTSARRPPPPKTHFRGAVRTGLLGFGAGAPLGHLEFDESRLRLWGPFGLRLDADRSAVRAIRLSTGMLAVRVRVIWADGRGAPVYFAAPGRALFRAALTSWGWPVEETKWGRPLPDESGREAERHQPRRGLWFRRVATGVVLISAGLLAGYGSAGAIWAGRNEAYLGNVRNAAGWAVLAVAPWLAATVSIAWLGVRLRRWSPAIKLAAATGAAGGVAAMLGAVLYGVSGL